MNKIIVQRVVRTASLGDVTQLVMDMQTGTQRFNNAPLYALAIMYDEKSGEWDVTVTQHIDDRRMSTRDRRMK